MVLDGPAVNDEASGHQDAGRRHEDEPHFWLAHTAVARLELAVPHVHDARADHATGKEAQGEGNVIERGNALILVVCQDKCASECDEENVLRVGMWPLSALQPPPPASHHSNTALTLLT